MVGASRWRTGIRCCAVCVWIAVMCCKICLSLFNLNPRFQLSSTGLFLLLPCRSISFDLDVDVNFNLKIPSSVPPWFRSDVQVNPNRTPIGCWGSEGDGRKRIVSFCRTNQGEAGCLVLRRWADSKPIQVRVRTPKSFRWVPTAMVQGVRVDPARFDPRSCVSFPVRELFRLLLLSLNCRFRWVSYDAVDG